MVLPEWAIAEAASIRSETEAKVLLAAAALAEDDHSQDALLARQAALWVQQNSPRLRPEWARGGGRSPISRLLGS